MVKPGLYLHHSGNQYTVLFSAKHVSDRNEADCVCYIDKKTGDAWSRPCSSFDMKFLSETQIKGGHFDLRTNILATKKDYPVRTFSFKNDAWVWF